MLGVLEQCSCIIKKPKKPLLVIEPFTSDIFTGVQWLRVLCAKAKLINAT